MKILYLAHRIPYPPNKGDKLRAFRQLQYLSERHDVWCACFVDDTTDLRYVDELRQYVRGVAAIPLHRTIATARGLFGWLAGQTITERYYRSAAMWRAIRALERSVSFDVVAAFSSSMAPYALSVPAGRRVLDLCDLDSAKWGEYALYASGPKRWLYASEGRRLAEREHRWIRSFDASILISEAERAALSSKLYGHKVHVVTNGVDVPAAAPGATIRQTGETAKPIIGFVGVMDYLPNVDAVCWFVETCWPAIHRTLPRATFRIVGRSPALRVRRLAAVPGVVVVGEVHDVRRELRQFDVSVAPLRIARGLQNKVLEAMAAGVPVLATSKAAAGLSAEPGRDLIVADEPISMIASGVELCRNHELGTQLAEAGRRYVATYHQWERVLEHYELIVTGATTPRSQASNALRASAGYAEARSSGSRSKHGEETPLGSPSTE